MSDYRISLTLKAGRWEAVLSDVRDADNAPITGGGFTAYDAIRSLADAVQRLTLSGRAPVGFDGHQQQSGGQ